MLKSVTIVVLALLCCCGLLGTLTSRATALEARPGPVITDFSATQGPGNYVHISGTVEGHDLGTIMVITGVAGEFEFEIESDGTFDFTVLVDGPINGGVGGEAVNPGGQRSDLALTYLF